MTHSANPALEAFAAHDADHRHAAPTARCTSSSEPEDGIQRRATTSRISCSKRSLSYETLRRRAPASTAVNEDRSTSTAAGLASQTQAQGRFRRRLGAPKFDEAHESTRPMLDPARLHPGDLRDHRLRPDRGVPRRALPDPHSVHVDVSAVPHRQRLVRRHAAPARDGARGEPGNIYAGLWYPVIVSIIGSS